MGDGCYIEQVIDKPRLELDIFANHCESALQLGRNIWRALHRGGDYEDRGEGCAQFVTQGGKEFVLGAVCRFGSIAGGGKLFGIFHAIGDVADVKLEDLGSLLDIQVADELQMTEMTCFGRDLQIVGAENAFFVQLVKCFFRRRCIGEEANLPKLPSE